VAGVLISLVQVASTRAEPANESATQASQDKVQLLVPGHVTEGKLVSHEGHVYELDLSDDQFLRFTVETEGPASNIQLTVFAPDGSKVEELSGPVCPFPLYFVATRSGAYRLSLSLLSDASPETYKLQIRELHGATDLDKKRAAAGRVMVEAYRLSPEDSPVSTQESTQKFDEAIKRFRAAGDYQGEAEVFQVLSRRCLAVRDYQKAVDYLRQAQINWHALAAYSNEALTLELAATYLLRLGKSEEELAALNEALSLRRASGDPMSEAFVLDGLGDVYTAMGEFQEALNCKEQALKIFQSTKSERIDSEYTALGDLGHIYEELGEPQKALDFYDQALALAQSHDNRGLEISMLLLIARAYAQDGDKITAFEHYNKALALAQGERDEEAPVLLQFGRFYLGQEEYEKALQCFNQVLPSFRSMHMRAFEAGALLGMGVVYHKLGRWQEALEVLRPALSSWPVKNRWPRETLREIGSVYQDLGDIPKALEYYENALSESRAAKDLQEEAFALADIAHAERAMRQNLEAQRKIEASLQILESLRARIVGSESRSAYFAMARKSYEFYIDLLMQMHAERPDLGLDRTAFQASERARARSLLDMLAESHVDVHEGADPKLLEREKKLQQRLRARSEYQVQLHSRPHTPAQANAVANELQILTAQYDEIGAQIRTTSPRYAALTQPVPLDVKQIQELVLDSNTLLLEYALGDDRSYLWAIADSALKSFTLPKRAEIEQATRRFYELTARNGYPKGDNASRTEGQIARAHSEYQAAAARLSQIILGPVAPLLHYKRLLIVSDGALQYIPYSVLPIPKQVETDNAPEQPLIAEFEVVTAPSASTVAVLRRDLRDRQPAPKTVAVLADPVFDSQDPRVLTHQPMSHVSHTGSQNEAVPRDLERSWAEAGSGEYTGRIPRLPFSRREADTIIASAPIGNSFEAVDFRASRITATSPELAQYRVVHFATHGVLDSRTPALSGIVLSLVDTKGKPQDGFLRLWDIYNLRLPVELVVLSGCQTALGKEVKGEGLDGLTRGFMYAGAARVMASLWKVDDAATAELMALFYQGIFKDNLRPAAALRAAQIQMWKRKRWHGDPYFWGAFQLQGEWK